VFLKDYEKRNGGMALNVYNNLVSLGVDCDILNNVEKIEKTRYVDSKTNHLFIRVDTDDKKMSRIDKKFLTKKYLNQYDVVIISDYDKGFLSKEDIERICYNHPLSFMDTKKNFGRWSKDCTWIKINEVEYQKTLKDIDNLSHIFDEKLIVTLSERGCRYRDKIFPVDKVEIKDLSGAGDTFLAGLVSKYLKTQDIEASIVFANECATKVVQLRGVNVI
jgi:D-beta-D-heptose 7-phosphate kinase/D-beta-D-heptose 1-phosphate adenosyltransferase